MKNSNNGSNKPKSKKSDLVIFIKESYVIYLIVTFVLVAIGVVGVLFFDADLVTALVAIPFILVVLFFVEYIMWKRANK